MKKSFKILLLGLLAITLFLPCTPSIAQQAVDAEDPSQEEDILEPLIESENSELGDDSNRFEYFRGEVLLATDDDYQNEHFPSQFVKIMPLEGSFKDQLLTFENKKIYFDDVYISVNIGEKVVVLWQDLAIPEFRIDSKYRLNSILWAVGLFLLGIIALTRWQGVQSIISLLASLAVLVFFIVPAIAEGQNIMLVSLVGAIVILAISMFIGHGINQSSMISFISASISLGLTVGLAFLFVKYVNLTGFGNEEAFLLRLGPLYTLDLKSLFMAGVIIGTVGILDDVAIVQTTLTEQIHKNNPLLNFKQLYKNSFKVGKEHIVSMVNTLVIIYAGVALPILIFYLHDNPFNVPLWVRLNADSLLEEIARALIGSSVLIITVPLTTLLATYIIIKRKGESKKSE